MDDKLNSPSRPSQREGGRTTRIFFRVELFLFLFLAPSLLKVLPFGKDLGWASSFSQSFTRTDTIPVKVNGNWLKNPWAGGHNYVQLSDIDMNFDGVKDLFVFDRTGNRITTYINKGAPNTVDYVDSTFKYASKFPHLEDWALLVDYNCDGKEDIFTYAINCGGIKIWKNTSTAGNLQFTLQTHLFYNCSCLTSQYYASGSFTNLYVSRVDIPSIEDVDGDGDLDVLTFDFSSTNVEYHINKSVEMGYNCDSLIFILDPNGCWGNFQENSINCSVNLSACRIMNPDSTGRESSSDAQTDNLSAERRSPSFLADKHQHSNETLRHTGSCLLCLDMDADGDKEIIIGDVSCCNMTLLTNGGSPSSADMIAKDTAFPSNNLPVNINLFPCGYYVDVDNDNKRDLIVAPNAPNISVNNESIWYYKNMGADNAPVFKRVKRNFLQDEMIDVGEGANPVFFDFDNDGLTDLLISNYTMLTDTCHAGAYNNTYNVYAFKNIGAAASPKFELVNTDFANLSVQMAGISGKHLAFGDLDGDGDQDMIIGDYDGFIHYFQNTGGAGPAIFIIPPVMNYPDDTGTPIDIGSYATPQLIDADRDGDMDLIIGERAGNLNYYENIGTSSSPSFTFITSSFGGVHTYPVSCCTGYSVPFMYDSAGSYRLIVGSEASRSYPATGWLWYYKNIDGNLGSNFTLVDSMYQNIWEGLRMTVNGKDINADGSMDLVIGNYAGGAALYIGDSNAVSVPELNHEFIDFNIYPNPFSETAVLQITNPRITNYELTIYNVFGQEVYNEIIRNSPFVISRGNLLQGIYFCEVRGENFTKAKKLILIK